MGLAKERNWFIARTGIFRDVCTRMSLCVYMHDGTLPIYGRIVVLNTFYYIVFRSTRMSHPHVLFGSPLARVDTLRNAIRPTPGPERLREMEDGFILDCIITDKLRYKWSEDIIPKYDARFDPHAVHYFKSPSVNLLLRKTITDVSVKSHNGNVLKYHCRIGPIPDSTMPDYDNYIPHMYRSGVSGCRLGVGCWDCARRNIEQKCSV